MTISNTINKFDKKIDSVYSIYSEAMANSLASFQTQIISLIETEKNPAIIRVKVQSLLSQSGYYGTVDDYLSSGYQSVLNLSADYYGELYNRGFEFSQESLKSFQDRKIQDLNRLNDLSTSTINEISGQLINAVNAKLPSKLTIEAVTNLATKFNNYAQVELETSIAKTYRASNSLLAKDNGIEKFQYVGPSTGNIRQFCSQHLGQIKSEQEWNELDNGKGQPKPVMDYQGGYRCRHSMVGVDEEFQQEFEAIGRQYRYRLEDESQN